ncbi:NAD-dependent epimerase/dehydratase family protein [Sphingomonas koreensis]|uniref:NAD-dependent epimerase/dehydratase family protein n=1 Tax=Sphingomonas koreensis TaxID=93064 RepID=UPI001F496FA2|nr:NAD-dependent epimerase/dehydratase family protein [Sphingomonas koreensis]
MHILLTGSSGWLGRYLAPMLRGAGHEVTGLDVAPGVEMGGVGRGGDEEWMEGGVGEKRIEGVVYMGMMRKEW